MKRVRAEEYGCCPRHQSQKKTLTHLCMFYQTYWGFCKLNKLCFDFMQLRHIKWESQTLHWRTTNDVWLQVDHILTYNTKLGACQICGTYFQPKFNRITCLFVVQQQRQVFGSGRESRTAMTTAWWHKKTLKGSFNIRKTYIEMLVEWRMNRIKLSCALSFRLCLFA